MSGNGEPVVEIDQLTFRWPRQHADTVSIEALALDRGEHLFVRGASGSGKTTLLNLLAGIHVPTTGTIRLLGTDMAHLAPSRRDRFRADHIGVVFQQFNLLPYLTMLENVAVATSFSRRKRARASDGTNQPSAEQLLASLNLPPEIHNSRVAELSVGQQQRVAVARALVGGPEILIADEPTSALDADNRDRFLELLFRQADAQGCTLIFVSHDPALASGFERTIELRSNGDTRSAA